MCSEKSLVGWKGIIVSMEMDAATTYMYENLIEGERRGHLPVN